MKNLETEYRKQVESEVPDLWDRINASLDEEEKKVPKKKSKIVMVRFGEIAAVAACLIISVVVIRNRFVVKNETASITESVWSEAGDTAAAADTVMFESSKKVEEACEPVMAEIAESNEADYETSQAAETAEYPSMAYDINEDGTYCYEGLTYQYLYEITGVPEGGDIPCTVVILSNREDVTFEETMEGVQEPEDFVVIEIY